MFLSVNAGGSFSLSWKLRMKVALGAAKGLAFLHSDQVRVIYRDFKTSNVLLDSVGDLQSVHLRIDGCGIDSSDGSF